MAGALDSRPLEHALAEARAACVTALQHGDTHALAAAYTADATLLPPATEPIRGREAIRRFWQAGLDAGIVAIRLEAATVDEDARLAYEFGSYEIHLEPAGSKPIVDRGSYVLVHARQRDSNWRRRVEIFTPAGRDE